NSRGLIHGGLIAALSHNAMGYSCAQAIGWDKRKSLLTISLAVGFIGSAEIGQRPSIEAGDNRTRSNICFSQSLIKADDVVIARASATFRVISKKEDIVVPGRA